jgi:hypothetical protein
MTGMTNGQIRDLCIALLHSETEDEVIGLLKTAGYWDQPALWRHYGWRKDQLTQNAVLVVPVVTSICRSSSSSSPGVVEAVEFDRAQYWHA